MPKLSKQVVIPHRADDVFELVADIEGYPDFIRWIRAMSMEGLRVDGDIRRFRGKADVGFKGFSERFATDIVADAGQRTIDVSLANGPFRRLRNSWKMRADGDNGTIVDFFIDYEFKNPVLSLLARANTNLAVTKIMQVFLAEADRRFGAPRT